MAVTIAVHWWHLIFYLALGCAVEMIAAEVRFLRRSTIRPGEDFWTHYGNECVPWWSVPWRVMLWPIVLWQAVTRRW